MVYLLHFKPKKEKIQYLHVGTFLFFSVGNKFMCDALINFHNSFQIIKLQLFGKFFFGLLFL